MKEKKLKELTEELIQATTERDMYEIDYELEKARTMNSAEVNAGNQAMREAQVIISLDMRGLYRKMAELKSKARICWYAWEGLKHEGSKTEN